MAKVRGITLSLRISRFGSGQSQFRFIAIILLPSEPFIQLSHSYSQMPVNERHFSEVIQEGFPCHLYFDLEFLWNVNPTCDPEEMVNILKVKVTQALKDHCAVAKSRLDIVSSQKIDLLVQQTWQFIESYN
jgi:hypothetical protein